MLRYAYFPEFKQGPKILLWGNCSDMNDLCDTVKLVATTNTTISLTDIRNSKGINGIKIVLRLAQRASGMRRISDDRNKFDWSLNSETAIDFSHMIRAVAESSAPSHQYLECGADGEIVVIVSQGEYPDDLAPQDL